MFSSFLLEFQNIMLQKILKGEMENMFQMSFMWNLQSFLFSKIINYQKRNF